MYDTWVCFAAVTDCLDCLLSGYWVLDRRVVSATVCKLVVQWLVGHHCDEIP